MDVSLATVTTGFKVSVLSEVIVLSCDALTHCNETGNNNKYVCIYIEI